MKQVVIIGAGPAGITAGYELLSRSKDYQVTILEASQELGGISRTVTYRGNRMDIGGHRFFSKDPRVNDWWQNILPFQGQPAYDYKKLNRAVTLDAGGPDPEQTDRVMLRRKRVSRIYYQQHFFDYPVRLNIRTLKNMGAGQTLAAGSSYLAACVHKLPEDSLENFYINRFGRKLYSMFFEGYTEKLWGRAARDISADWGAQRVKGLSVTAVLKDMLRKLRPASAAAPAVETSLIEEFAYPKLGPGQLWATAADDFVSRGGQILFDHEVCGFENHNGRIEALRWTGPDGQSGRIPADIIISSMPLKDLTAGLQQVPADISAIARGLPYRDFVTVGLLVSRLNLKNETAIPTLGNIVPDNWIYVQDTGVKLGRIQIFNNWSPYMVAQPEDTVWMGLEYFCAEGDPYWQQSDAAWKEQGVQELLRMGVLDSPDVVLDYHCEKVRKAYPAYFDTYASIDRLIAYLNQWQNLYCVGRNGQHRYNNMDHSMETAFQAVDNILSGRLDKRNIWQVNIDQTYQESQADAGAARS